jgi:hypothetical protein
VEVVVDELDGLYHEKGACVRLVAGFGLVCSKYARTSSVTLFFEGAIVCGV